MSDQLSADFQLTPGLLDRDPIDPAHTAIVVVDMVNWNVPRSAGETGLASAFYVERLARLVIPNHRRLLDACREAGIQVVFLRVGCARSDHLDGTPTMKGVFDEYGAHDGTYACEVIHELSPLEGDLALLKTGSGGFTTSALDSHLRNAGIRQVFYTGVVTNGCVMATAIAGFDLGYFGFFVSDATATQTQEFQDQAENLIGSVYARKVTTNEALALIANAQTRNTLHAAAS